MNWNEIGTQLIIGIIGIIISGLGILITYVINKYVKNDELKQIMNSLNDLVRNSVLEVQQIYVDEMKCNDMFDKDAQKLALERCIDTIRVNMPKRVEEWLKSNYTNVDAYLKTLVEAQIKLLKLGGK